jgi:hypothetical protein
MHVEILTCMAHSSVGDPNFCPVMPWVVNFSRDPDVMIQQQPTAASMLPTTSQREVTQLEELGWCDLTRSKFRLTKGMSAHSY